MASSTFAQLPDSTGSVVTSIARSSGVPLVAACVGKDGGWDVERAAAIALLHGLPGHAVQLLTAAAADLRVKAATLARTGRLAGAMAGTQAPGDVTGGVLRTPGPSRWHSPQLRGMATPAPHMPPSSAMPLAPGSGAGGRTAASTSAGRSGQLLQLKAMTRPTPGGENLAATAVSHANGGGPSMTHFGHPAIGFSPAVGPAHMMTPGNAKHHSHSGYQPFPLFATSPPASESDPAGAHAELLQLTAMAIAGCPGPAQQPPPSSGGATPVPVPAEGGGGGRPRQPRDAHANRGVWLHSVRSLMTRIDGGRHPYLKVCLTVLVEVADPQLPDVPQPLAGGGRAARAGQNTSPSQHMHAGGQAAAPSAARRPPQRPVVGHDEGSDDDRETDPTQQLQLQQQNQQHRNPHRVDTLRSSAAGQAPAVSGTADLSSGNSIQPDVVTGALVRSVSHLDLGSSSGHGSVTLAPPSSNSAPAAQTPVKGAHVHAAASVISSTSSGAGDGAADGRHIEISLHDRVAFAVRYLDGPSLGPFLRTITAECIEGGRIDGLLLTGLSPSGSRLVQRYLDASGDVQTAAIVGCYMIRAAQVYLARRLAGGPPASASGGARGEEGGARDPVPSGGPRRGEFAMLPPPTGLLPSIASYGPPPPDRSAVDATAAAATGGGSLRPPLPDEGRPQHYSSGGGGAPGGGPSTTAGLTTEGPGGPGGAAHLYSSLAHRHLDGDMQRMVHLAWRWVGAYRETLTRLRLWGERALFDVQRAKLLRCQFRGGAPPLPRASVRGGFSSSSSSAAGSVLPAGGAEPAGDGDDGERERLAFMALLSLASYSAGLTPQPSAVQPTAPPGGPLQRAAGGGGVGSSVSGWGPGGGGLASGTTGGAAAGGDFSGSGADRSAGDGILALGPRRSQLHVRCPSCRTSLSLPALVSGSASALEWLSRQRPAMACCPSCRKPLPRCSLCLLPVGCLNPALQLKHEMRARQAQASSAGVASSGGGGGGGGRIGSYGNIGGGGGGEHLSLRSPPLLSLNASHASAGGGSLALPQIDEREEDGAGAMLAHDHRGRGSGVGADGTGLPDSAHADDRTAGTGDGGAPPAGASSSPPSPFALFDPRPPGHLRDSQPFDDMWAWCAACKHGGHASHLRQWFATGKTVCPVAECMCHCALLDRHAGALFPHTPPA